MSVSKTAKHPWVVTGRENKDILAYRFPNLEYSPMGKFILYRLVTDRDIKAITTSKGNTTGTGKTTLTLFLCRLINQWSNQLFNKNTEWNAEEHSFMDIWGYIEKYDNAEPGTVLFTDELETIIDRRRSMTHENVKFSHKWQKLRYKNVVTFATAPSLHNLDKRVKENLDIWINVTMQGRANVYFLTMHDFVERLIFKRFKQNGYRQSLLWLPPEEDEDYEYLKQLKATISAEEKDDEITEQDVDDAKKEILDTVILNTLDLKDKRDLNITQEDLANKILDGERSQQYISKVKRENNS